MPEYFAHDLSAEIATLLENYRESEGHAYSVEATDDTTLTVTVTGPHAGTFRIDITPVGQ